MSDPAATEIPSCCREVSFREIIRSAKDAPRESTAKATKGPHQSKKSRLHMASGCRAAQDDPSRLHITGAQAPANMRCACSLLIALYSLQQGCCSLVGDFKICHVTNLLSDHTGHTPGSLED